MMFLFYDFLYCDSQGRVSKRYVRKVVLWTSQGNITFFRTLMVAASVICTYAKFSEKLALLTHRYAHVN